MVGRSQLGSRKGGRRPLQYDGEKDEGRSGKIASGGGLYTLRKQRMGRYWAPSLEAGKSAQFTTTQIIYPQP